ncbi:MAG: iron-containing redox enzyme family protein [Methylococcaceae bacterium]|nr:iron-containing redox enzyme family protein [Methylococcaceae bacterium]
MMNKFAHPLAVNTTPLFDSDAGSLELDSRTLFYQLVHVSEHPAVLEPAYAFITQQCLMIKQFPMANFSSAYQPELIEEGLNNTAFKLTASGLNLKDLSTCLVQMSPVLLTETAILNNIVQAGTNQTALTVDLFSASLALNADDQTGAFLQANMLSNGKAIPSLHTWAFAQQPLIQNCLFDFGALQLALAQFPRVFFAEILGFSYAYCQAIGLLERAYAQANDNVALSQFLQARQHRLQAQLPALLKVIRDYLEDFPLQQTALWLRIQTGYWLYQQQTDCCYQQLQTQLAKPLSTQQALVVLLQRIIPNAIGHHGNIQLAGKSIDAWFASSPFDSEVFLQALKQSAYIDQQNPSNSRLLKLFEFKGPMFGVLNAADKGILKAWVCGEPTIIPAFEIIPTLRRGSAAFDAPASHNAGALRDEFPRRNVRTIITPIPNYARLSNRDWYHTLVNIELFPAALNTAKQKVSKLLTLTRLFNRSPFKYYNHQNLNDYINAVYQQEVKAYQPLTAPPGISKQTYIWGIEQLAPAILTDGCWLQNISQLSYHPTQSIGALLFKIYADELGGGILTQNHPYIYQQLLGSIGLHLPPIHSREFSQHPGFIDSAFDIPCYLMAISKFPSAFLPELLGLNLAIELSGLGKDYLRLAQALTYYGLDPTIVNVHISIDNVATGHTALAQQAIQLYLDGMLANSGEAIMQQHWQRIYTGYCSLAAVGRRFKVALVTQGILKRLSRTFTSPFNSHLTVSSTS